MYTCLNFKFWLQEYERHQRNIWNDSFHSPSEITNNTWHFIDDYWYHYRTVIETLDNILSSFIYWIGDFKAGSYNGEQYRYKSPPDSSTHHRSYYSVRNRNSYYDRNGRRGSQYRNESRNERSNNVRYRVGSEHYNEICGNYRNVFLPIVTFLYLY